MSYEFTLGDWMLSIIINELAYERMVLQGVS